MGLKEWVKSAFDDLELLEASTFQYRPGVILKPHGSSEIRSAVWTLLGETPDNPFYAIKRGPGLLGDRDFDEKRSGGAKLKIPGIVSLSFQTSREIKAHFEVEGVEVELFEHTFESDIDQRLRTLKDTPLWAKFIDDHRVVTESWYMRSLKITFSTQGSQMASVDVEKEVKIGAEGNRSWSSNDVLSIVSNGVAPFAVRTFRP